MHHAFLYISLPSTARLPVKMPNFTFCERRKQAMTKFILFLSWNNYDRDWKNVKSLFHATFSWLSAVVVSFKNSPVFTQDAWPMQAWIPVVSSSLYFWKSVFSFRADNIFKSDGDFISHWKFADCAHFFGAWARQAVIETIAIVYELTKGAQEKLFADWAQSGAHICLNFWK